MPLTPADIHHIDFAKSAIGKRGYDEEQVDALLDDISQEMIRLLDENALLQRRAADSDAAPPPAPAGPDLSHARAALADELDRAVRARDVAEQRARDLQGRLDRARQEAAAEAKAALARTAVISDTGPVMEAANRNADEHVRLARQECVSLVAEARERSEQVVEDAYRAAAETERHRRQEIADTRDRHEALIREVAQLEKLAEEYRAALSDDVARQVRLLTAPPT